MKLIAKDSYNEFALMLNAYDCPAILVSANYQILATNHLYQSSFGELDNKRISFCYEVSHGYQVPCDQAGENCPLSSALASGKKERVLHIHQTPKGKEHVDVELLPIKDESGKLIFFIELLKPVNLASAEVNQHEMVGSSDAFNKLVENITRVGPSDASVLLLGESGSGKELAALAIHKASQRSGKPMVTLECAGLTESLFESELFGHVKGAFTGATYSKQGLVEEANGGTLFLDEIGDVPLSLQVKLLRLIETGSYRPVGSREVKSTNFRLICASHRDMFALVEEGKFRQDLYYRINVFPIYLPSINERLSDMGLLAKAILNRLDDSGEFSLTDSAILALKQHHYKGNIRELRNILARALVCSNTRSIDESTIENCLAIDERVKRVSSPLNVQIDLKANEKKYLTELLRQCEGNKEQAAKIAGVSLRSFYRKLL